jgi:hypothetical protein
MKKALFELHTVISPWKPPFRKIANAKELEVTEGQGFDSMEKVQGSVFTLLKCDSDKCLVRFSEKFTLKGHEHPGNREIWVGREPISFTYLWGNNGITKSLSVKRILVE